MKKYYVFRLDDITPGMKTKAFWKLIDIFRDQSVVPLLGVVPDNKDPELVVEDPGSTFWEDMRRLQDDGTAEFAQHGCNHVYTEHAGGILGRYLPIKKQSEFADVPYDLQKKKIEDGKRILQDNKICTDVWIAPGHTFDFNTVDILKKHGFKYISDGIGRFPYKLGGLTLVPQQYWEPEPISFGAATICIHPNTISDGYPDTVYNFIKSERADVVPFSKITTLRIKPYYPVVNSLCHYYHRIRHRL